ncbi:TBP-associated factor II 15 [Actinidia rufa]|uniref:TBP-associated factor II 15 n=1 Tax=Actinidia rufa TaxID=165716 RepID=A0A7J0FDC8_9ERIC|nr:TBP-associated factor II 15 [Actinidia rufa]
MNHNQQSSEGRHDDDSALSDFLASLMDYKPPLYIFWQIARKSGFQCPDVRFCIESAIPFSFGRIRLVAVATQKFIAEVANDALQHCKARQASIIKDKRDKQQKDKRSILTMEDLSKALREVRSIGLQAILASKVKMMSPNNLRCKTSYLQILEGI